MSGTFATGLRRTVHALGEGFKGLVVSPGQTLACMVSLAVAGCLVWRAIGDLLCLFTYFFLPDV